MTIEERAEKLFGKDYITFPVKYIGEHGHGDTLSVKIVLPVRCQANCSFCFNKVNRDTQMHDVPLFFENLEKSLKLLKENLPTRKITLDITGNEPTYSLLILRRLLNTLEEFKDDMVDKIVLTTNGFRLGQMIDLGPVDIVNISLHDYRFVKRLNIFHSSNIPSDLELQQLCGKYNTTAVAVCDESCTDLEEFVSKFASWAQEMGFKNARIRTDYLSKGSIFYNSFKDSEIEECPGLDKKELVLNGFNVKLYRGIKDLTSCIMGTEVIIDDDGKLYLDYYKRYPIGAEELKAFDSNIYVKPKEE